ncbi:SpoIIE family protein phosphatase [Kitasatospora sp. NPDC096204]|uniref:SpoIIE family protein phosphatase n=1 Tax=Kitasatospora sp. NPDC096204 TaxID=3364094 RepID=UPI00380545FF
MGHDPTSGLTTSVATAAARNARRAGRAPVDVVGSVDRALARWQPDHFCTGVPCGLDAVTGVLHRINCGHPASLLIRTDRVLHGALDSGQPPAAPDRPGRPTRPGSPTGPRDDTGTGRPRLLYTDGSTRTASWRHATRAVRSSASTGSPTSSSAPPPPASARPRCRGRGRPADRGVPRHHAALLPAPGTGGTGPPGARVRHHRPPGAPPPDDLTEHAGRLRGTDLPAVRSAPQRFRVCAPPGWVAAWRRDPDTRGRPACAEWTTTPPGGRNPADRGSTGPPGVGRARSRGRAVSPGRCSCGCWSSWCCWSVPG